MPQTINVGARSVFVTATAWAFIVLSVLASGWALVQNAYIASLLPGIAEAGSRASLPPLIGLLMAYLPWVAIAGLAMSLPR